MTEIDTELTHFNLCDQLRANSSFMKVMATLFYYGNQTMSAAQLVTAVRALELLPLRGETPKSTIQGIISTSRKTARDLNKPDPFRIEKEGTGRQAKYCISEEVLNGADPPPPQEIPDEPILLKPVEYATSRYHQVNHLNHTGKRQRKMSRSSKHKRRRNGSDDYDDNVSDVEIDTDDEFLFGATEEDSKGNMTLPEEDTIFDYTLLHSPPEADDNYIDPIDFTSYPVASYFAVVQQKGYSYPRFRSHEKIKIPKVQCEDKYRVADITGNNKKDIIGRVFILADGHGGAGCAEYFVRHIPHAIQQLCDEYDPDNFDDKSIHQRFEKDVKIMVNKLDEDYLDIKRKQLGRRSINQLNGGNQQQDEENAKSTTPDAVNTEETTSDDKKSITEPIPSTKEETVDNDGCTLIINIFFGVWMVNVNVGDSRSILISAPEPGVSSPPTTTAAATATTAGTAAGTATTHSVSGHSASTSPYVIPPGGYDKDYIMDVVFASQDHKPYLEHLVREILENGGEFVDSVQNRVIKVELDKLREDGNRQAKRFALKNARIRPKEYQAGQDYSQGESTFAWSTQSAVRTTVNNDNNNNNNNNNDNNTENDNNSKTQHSPASPNDARPNIIRPRSRHDYVPSLNVARSCGDLDFKLDSRRKIISCEPDVTFIRIADEKNMDISTNSPLSSIAPRTFVTSGPSKTRRRNFLFMSTDGTFDYMYEETPERQNRAIAKMLGPLIEDGEKIGKYLLEEEERSQTIQHDDTTGPTMEIDMDQLPQQTQQMDINNNKVNGSEAENGKQQNGDIKMDDAEHKEDGENNKPQTRKPLLFRELDEKETKVRNTKEKTLVTAARFFANREGAHGFFSATLQDYDDCTILLVEI
ncbi:hypothetical protein BC941DRAFT_512705 [Chlamydoabsidia padenii]|nr:hypothetical protein BC941DRAFT_512705 [Chlamydoabsidia padenii]